MVNAQEYLNQNYPDREKTTKINLSNQELEGNLIIKDFPNLEEIKCGGNKNITSIELSNLSKLNHFHANNCQLTNLEINDCPNISYLNVANNLLTNLTFLNNLNSEKLTTLSVHSNNFSEQTLEMFSKFTNLQELFLDNCDKAKFRKGIYNRFTGSLKPLQSLTRLEILSIGKTDIDSGLEYIPESLRKIGFNSAIKVNAGCSKLSRELKEASKIEKVTEKLQQHEGNDPSWYDNYYRIAPWRQALNLLGEKRFREQNTEQWLNKNYPKENIEETKKRENIAFLTINDKSLEGHLDLRDFIKLEKLDCSDNKLTSLDLSNCSKLTHLYCDNNSFADLDFLKTLPCPNKLKEIYLEDNKELFRQKLDFLTSYTELTELNVENCPFYGSLKPLKDLSKLERIYISNTDINDGLDDLPKSCQRIYCNNNQNDKESAKITNQLGKHSEEKIDENSKTKRYYNLDEWKRNKQDEMTASIVPLERLYVIRGNIRQFINKWGKETEDDLFDKYLFIKRTKEEVNNLNELSKLQSPSKPNDELKKDRWAIYGTQAFGRSAAIAGTVLTFQDQGAIGGGILGAYPIAELLVSKLEERLKDKETKWNEFLNDADTFSDNFNELLGMTKSIKIGSLGKVNKAFKDLKGKVDGFLKDYDEDENGEIDLEELKSKRKELAQDLLDNEENGKLQEIINAMKSLEDTVIAYRQGTLSEEETNQLKNQNQVKETQNKETQTEDITTRNQSETIIDLDEHFEANQSLNNSQANLLDKSQKEVVEMQNLESKKIAQIQQVDLPYGVPGSSK